MGGLPSSKSISTSRGLTILGVVSFHRRCVRCSTTAGGKLPSVFIPHRISTIGVLPNGGGGWCDIAFVLRGWESDFGVVRNHRGDEWFP